MAIATSPLTAQRAGATRSTRGDTVVVQTTGPGIWGPIRDAQEVLRIGGEREETTFGTVYQIAATPDGGVVLFDTKGLNGPVLRQFDASGKFVRNIGRQGRGPGEYDSPFGPSIAVAANGTIVLRDGRRVVNRYSAADGRFLTGIALNHDNGSTNEVYAMADGSVYVRAAFRRGRPPAAPSGPEPLVRYDTLGNKLDSIISVKPWLASPATGRYAPRDWWYVFPDGRLLYTRNDLVGFLAIDRAGNKPPFLASATVAPVRFLPEERKELEDMEAWRQANFPPEARGPASVIPDFKALAGGALSDLNGRIWVARPGVAVKGTPRVAARAGDRQIMTSYEETYTHAAFQSDGTFLGELRFPPGSFPTFTGDFAWAMVRGQDDEQFLVKFRIR